MHSKFSAENAGSPKLDKLPINTQLQAFYNVERLQFAADWQLRFQFQFLFPK
jgi:hypothetical protein